jgi:HEAT repeat protein
MSIGYLSYARADDSLPGVVFVSDVIFGEKYEWPGVARPGTAHWREGYIYHRATTQHPIERTTTPTRPGRNLYTLVPARPDGKLTRITHLTDGELFDPEPSHDGTRILFSMRRDGEDWYNLYEIGVDGGGLVQLTDGPFNDVSGVYLPDGRIVFVSDRAGYLEEYHEERTENLWIMNADGSGIGQLTFNPGTVFDPTVLSDGRILFSLWDVFMLNVPGPDKHETYLMTIRPDGTEESHFFGARQYRFFNRERHSGVALNQPSEMPDGKLLVITEMGPSILDPTRGLKPEEALWPIFPGTTTIQLGGATHRVHLSPNGSRSTPYALPDGRFLFAATLPGARDLGIYLGDPKTRQCQLVFNDPTTSEFDPRPILLKRPRPALLPAKAAFAGARRFAFTPRGSAADRRVAVTGRARYAVIDGRRSDNPEHARALRRARYYRVIEALHTAVTTSSHTSLATRILGVAPILPDGSCYFEAPADTPLFLEPLDAAGRRVPFEWNYPVTSVPIGSQQPLMEVAYVSSRAGELKSCHGCHAPQDSVARQPGLGVALTRKPAQLHRDLTDIVYRRNEPDEYRCGARVGEAPKYRPWLESPDPDLRRRACQMLAAIEDGARPHAPRIAELLGDESVEVRRAAALALGRLGNPDSATALLDALDDGDWQVRFHAASALEGITACTPGTKADDEAARDFYRLLLSELDGVNGLKRAVAWGPRALGTLAQQHDAGFVSRWFEAVGRLGASAPERARRVVRSALDVPVPAPVSFEPWAGKRHALEGRPPELAAVRAAGWMRDAPSVPLLVPWLSRPEYQDHATEAAVALGRIGTEEAIEALWKALREQVPDRQPFLSRYLQRGPRPEEYAILRGLILAAAVPKIDDAHLIVALIPGSFLEKPRFEDWARPESQRVLLGRVLLNSAGLREKTVRLLVGVLRGEQALKGDPLYDQILKGINLERPFAEHRRPFPVVSRIEPEQALWLLGCLATGRPEVPEAVILPYLTSESWRERIDATVLLHRFGFGPKGAEVLLREADKPYAFKEIMGIGKSHPDTNFRDKCYMVMALARHVGDVKRLGPFADPKRRYRDVRYGLALGLGHRGKPDGIGLLTRLATGDPVSVVRRHARESLRAIQETQQMAGHPVPAIELPDPQPFEACYPPRGLTWPEAVVERSPAAEPRGSSPGESTPPGLAALRRTVADALAAENFRDLNNSNNQAPGAKRMMIRGVDELDRAVRVLSAEYPESAGEVFRQLLDSPYPLAHYLALREVSEGGHPEMDAVLIAKLEAFAKTADTVGFFWICEALRRRGVQSALPALARYATDEEFSGLHGPVGMGYGYPAARAVAYLTADISHPDVQRLLASENIWLAAGALAGLTEAQAPGVEPLLRELLDGYQPGLIHDHAAVGLTLLRTAAQAGELAGGAGVTTPRSSAGRTE